jgi:cyclohexanecarboxylate-CoA ligase
MGSGHAFMARAGAGQWARYWKHRTLAQYLDQWAAAAGSRPAAVDGAGRYTYAELARASRLVAHGLAAAGARPGDVIACQLPNWNEFVLVAVAASRLGAALTPIPPTFRRSEVGFILRATRARVFIVPRSFRGFDHAAMAAGLRAELPDLEAVFVCRGAAPAGTRRFEELLDPLWRAGLPSQVDPGAVAEVIFTSGTTGEPKGVMHTANTLFSILHPLVDRLGFSSRDVTLMPSTFGHQTGFLYGVCLTLLLGATGVWLDIWSPEAAAELIERERVSWIMGATPFLRDLVASQALDRRDARSLRLFISAGAPIPRDLVREARRRLGCAISAGWGMSENGLVTVNALDDPEDKVAGTDGRPLDGMELRVVGPDGAPLPPGADGELHVRGHSLFVGYWERPALTREAWTPDGWFITGDRGRIDRDGYLSITGRSKDLIIRGGENISPVEIENLLYTHPKVQAVAVVGASDPRLGERVCAVVVPRPGQRVELAELVAFLESRQLARFKLPERLELVEELPMTPSGKIQKFKLRERLRGGGSEEARP